MLNHLKTQVRRLKTELFALYLASCDPRVPWYAKLFAAIVVGYAFSPIDLIPDIIPIVGYLDDLLLVPLGIVVAIKLIPAPVMAECREKARAMLHRHEPTNRFAAMIILGIWGLMAVLGFRLLVR
jgi:uncharacterized membrane protein YkvA (DUF1232 family)